MEILSNVILFLTIPWVIFSLLATLCDAVVGYIDEWLLHKVKGDSSINEIDAPGQLILISGLFGLIVSGVSLILVNLTPLAFTLSKESLLYAFAAGVLEVLWLIPYFYAMDRGGALNTTPLFQTIPIFSLFIGLAFFGEIPALVHILATVIIVLGAVLLNYSPQEKRLEYKTILLMMLASLTISFGYFLFKDAAESANFMTALFGNGIGMGFLSLLIWILWRPYREQFLNRIRKFDTKIIVLQTANEGLYTLGSVFNQLAIVLGPTVMVVSTMNAFHPVFTLLIGILLARIGLSRYAHTFDGVGKFTKAIAIMAIAFGTLLIAL